MEIQSNDVIGVIAAKLDRYGKFTDVSDIAFLFDRFLRTYNAETQSFLLGRVYSRLKHIEKTIPAVMFAQEPPVIRELSAGIKIGSISVGAGEFPFMLSKEDLNKNILIAASVGHGKTSLVYNILSKLSTEKTTYIVFDLKKDYKSLSLQDNTIFFGKENLRVNPLLPPKGISIKEWVVHFVDAFSHSFSLLVGSRDFLLDSLNKFYMNLEENTLPSLPKFLTFLESMPVKNEYIKVVKGRIKALLSSTETFSYEEGISFSDLDDKNLVLSIDHLGIPEQIFLLSFVLSYVFYMNLNDFTKRNLLHKLIVIDDAHTLLDVNKDRDHAMGIPLIHQMISKMRELGVGFIFADQQISSLVSSAIQNSNIKFIGRINLVEDFNKLFSFPIESSIPNKIASLNVGEFLVISPKITPYAVIKVDPVRIQKDISEEVLAIKNKTYAPQNQVLTISQYEKEFLEEVNKFPTLNVSIHRSNLVSKLGDQQFYKIKNNLINKGDLCEVSLELSDNKISKFMYIPDTCSNIIKDMGIRTWSKKEITRKILRYVITQKLKKDKISFQEDEIGILINGLRKIYIIFDGDSTELLRISETSFDKIINVVGDSSGEESAIRKVTDLHSTRNINASSIKVCKVKEFNLI